MVYRSFKKWLVSEGKDIFGFDDGRTPSPLLDLDDNPITPIRTGLIIQELSKLSVGVRSGNSPFNDQVEWGSNPGSLQAYITPPGALRTILRRQILDLEGNAIWVCKKVIPFMGNDKQKDEQAWVSTIYDQLKEIDSSLEEMPIRAWTGLEKLVAKLSGQIQHTNSNAFTEMHIKEVSQYYYIIYMDMSGYGLEAPNSIRVEQFDINVAYMPESGLIRIWGADIASPTRQHKWIPMPSRWDEYFSPAQGNEIVKAVSELVRSF